MQSTTIRHETRQPYRLATTPPPHISTPATSRPGVATSPPSARAAELLTYHSMEDQIIASENSARYYAHVINIMAAAPSALDSFYRYLRISGMGHCGGGEGTWSIGRASLGPATSLDPSSNVLMALVRWVENETAPETIRGLKFVGDNPAAGVDFTRKHCRYPFKNFHVESED